MRKMPQPSNIVRSEAAKTGKVGRPRKVPLPEGVATKEIQGQKVDPRKAPAVVPRGDNLTVHPNSLSGVDAKLIEELKQLVAETKTISESNKTVSDKIVFLVNDVLKELKTLTDMTADLYSAIAASLAEEESNLVEESEENTTVEEDDYMTVEDIMRMTRRELIELINENSLDIDPVREGSLENLRKAVAEFINTDDAEVEEAEVVEAQSVPDAFEEDAQYEELEEEEAQEEVSTEDASASEDGDDW